MELKNVVIVAQKENWYCKKCKIAHDRLYIDDFNSKYCDKCASDELKSKVVQINQVREKI